MRNTILLLICVAACQTAQPDGSATPGTGTMCTMELRLLMPNETQTATTDLPRDLPRGTYRIVLSLSRQSASNPGTVRAISPTFTGN